jgi:hypothetical protein
MIDITSASLVSRRGAADVLDTIMTSRGSPTRWRAKIGE